MALAGFAGPESMLVFSFGCAFEEDILTALVGMGRGRGNGTFRRSACEGAKVWKVVIQEMKSKPKSTERATM